MDGSEVPLYSYFFYHHWAILCHFCDSWPSKEPCHQQWNTVYKHRIWVIYAKQWNTLYKSSPYHPASNGLAVRAVQTFKVSMQKLPTSDSLETRISKFLFWYRVTPHSTMGVPPSELLFGRVPHSLLDLPKPDLSTKVQKRQEAQKANYDRHAKEQTFKEGNAVFVKDFPTGKNWFSGSVTEVHGPLSYHVTLSDGTVVRRYVEHIYVWTSQTLVSDTPVESDIEIPTVQPAPQPAAPLSNSETTPPLPHRSTRVWVLPDYYQAAT